MPSSIVENPSRNIPENLFHFSMDNDLLAFPKFKKQLEGQSIRPDEYPCVIDLGSGDGGVAAFLVKLGWENNNITCVDKLVPPYPAVREVVWQYIDLEVMAL